MASGMCWEASGREEMGKDGQKVFHRIPRRPTSSRTPTEMLCGNAERIPRARMRRRMCPSARNHVTVLQSGSRGCATQALGEQR